MVQIPSETFTETFRTPPKYSERLGRLLLLPILKDKEEPENPLGHLLHLLVGEFLFEFLEVNLLELHYGLLRESGANFFDHLDF